MMEKKEILESGMLEQYLLGELPAAEAEMVEKLLREDEEVQKMYSDMESDLEQMATENAITPPQEVKHRIMDGIDGSTMSVIPLTAKKKNNPWLAIAASVAVLLGITSVWLYSELNSAEENLQLVEQQKSALEDEMTDVLTNYDEVTKWYATINDPDAIKVVLKGNEKSPTARAVSYVNHTNKSVVLNTKGLPQLDAEHDYQLWADVEGEMIDMGVITKNTEMIAMNYIENAESLNITIEPAGGNDHPTVENLISNVYL